MLKGWLLFFSITLLACSAWAKPRHPFPSTPDEVGQNDRDLDDQITQLIHQSSTTLLGNSTNYIQNRNTLQSGTTAYPSFLYVGSSISVPSLVATTSGTIQLLVTSTITSATGLVISTTGATTNNYFFGPSSATIGTPTLIKGMINGASIPAYNYGETISSVATVSANFPTSGNFGDLVSVTLTPGHWLLYAQIEGLQNGATVTAMEIGISNSSGNSGTGLVSGDNDLDIIVPTATTGSVTTANISAWEIKISVADSYFLKFRASYTVATPKARGRLTAIRY